jgi:tRNA A-37 threonylcarbamoyl transferase component Bud32
MALTKYSGGETDWFLEESDLFDIVSRFSHPAEERRRYAVYDRAGKRIFLKSFREEGVIGRMRHIFSPRGKTEFRVGSILGSLGIPTPKVFGYGTGRKNSVVIEEHVEGESLLAVIERTADRRPLLQALAGMLKLLSEKGVRHNDLHLDNILVSEGRLILVDLHKTKIKRAFARGDELSNVTHALATVYDDLSAEEKEFFFDCYEAEPLFRDRVRQVIMGLKKEWIANKKRRAFRDTSVLRVSGGYVYMRGAKDKAHGDFVKTLKRDRKVLVERFGDHIRKPYASRSRLNRAWENHVALAYLGSTSVPAPFYLKRAPLFGRGHIAMADLGAKGEELDRHLDREYDRMTPSARRNFVENIAGFLGSLLSKRIMHKDMKGCNLFVLEDCFALLDVEDILFGEPTEGALEKMLVQLNTTLPVRILWRDRARFLIRLAKPFGMDCKALFAKVGNASIERDVVYEGVAGLKRERFPRGRVPRKP